MFTEDDHSLHVHTRSMQTRTQQLLGDSASFLWYSWGALLEGGQCNGGQDPSYHRLRQSGKPGGLQARRTAAWSQRRSLEPRGCLEFSGGSRPDLVPHFDLLPPFTSAHAHTHAFCDRVLLCGPDCLRTSYVDKAVLKVVVILISAS